VIEMDLPTGVEPQHVLGGWRCWWGRLLARASFNEFGIRVVILKDNDECIFGWHELLSLQVGDASRATLTRVATVGLAGLGMKKSQVRLSFVATEFGNNYPIDITLQYASEAEVISLLQALAPHNPAIGPLMGWEQPAVSAVDASTRLRELQGLVDQGLISNDEYQLKRDEIIQAI
jgi:hypothetical protein